MHITSLLKSTVAITALIEFVFSFFGSILVQKRSNKFALHKMLPATVSNYLRGDGGVPEFIM